MYLTDYQADLNLAVEYLSIMVKKKKKEKVGNINIAIEGGLKKCCDGLGEAEQKGGKVIKKTSEVDRAGQTDIKALLLFVICHLHFPKSSYPSL